MRFKINGHKVSLILRTCIRFFLIGLLWQVLELIFYGEIQPRIVDDIIGLFLFYYIYRSEQRCFWKY